MASDLLLTTKLYVPRAHHRLVPRPRLVDTLDQALEHRLCLVSAPAGFGKTTLLSEWIGLRRIPVAWLSLEQTLLCLFLASVPGDSLWRSAPLIFALSTKRLWHSSNRR